MALRCAVADVDVRNGRMNARARVLGLLNPLLALLPLDAAGPGADSPCLQLVRDASGAAAAPARLR